MVIKMAAEMQIEAAGFWGLETTVMEIEMEVEMVKEMAMLMKMETKE